MQSVERMVFFNALIVSTAMRILVIFKNTHTHVLNSVRALTPRFHSQTGLTGGFIVPPSVSVEATESTANEPSQSANEYPAVASSTGNSATSQSVASISNQLQYTSESIMATTAPTQSNSESTLVIPAQPNQSVTEPNY
ncbi:unnamed protein product, partial [Mucor circinelloides]